MSKFTVEEVKEGFEFISREEREIYCYVFNSRKSKGSFGEFLCLDVVTFNPNAASKDEFIASIQLRSMGCDTVLTNKVDSGLLYTGGFFFINLKVAKGEKFENDAGKMELSTYNRWFIGALNPKEDEMKEWFEIAKSKAPKASKVEVTSDAPFEVESAGHEIPVL